jgi:hypothetical protein
MLNYGLYRGQLIIMLKKHQHVINDDLGSDFYNLKNPKKWHNVLSNLLQKRKGRRRKFENKIVVKYEKKMIHHIMDFLLCYVRSKSVQIMKRLTIHSWII